MSKTWNVTLYNIFCCMGMRVLSNEWDLLFLFIDLAFWNDCYSFLVLDLERSHFVGNFAHSSNTTIMKRDCVKILFSTAFIHTTRTSEVFHFQLGTFKKVWWKFFIFPSLFENSFSLKSNICSFSETLFLIIHHSPRGWILTEKILLAVCLPVF